ncbi:MAG: hypothetical protein K6D57_06120 [Paludibacteraceae bacterium]|nr:hypothetical protein [Paludibacteraceae bacterium]
MSNSQIIGAVGTVIFLILMFLFLIFFGLHHSVIDPPVNQVEIEMDLGTPNAMTGGELGDGQDGAPAEQIASQQAEPSPASSEPANPVMTQEDPSIAIAKAEKQKAERERQLLLAAEKARKEKEAKEAAAKKAKTDKANALAAGAFKNGGGAQIGDGSGAGGKGTKPGNPAGKGAGSGSGKGYSWNLAGRDLKSVEKPEYKGNQTGKIVVNIYVNNAGNVIAADIAQGTTISEKSLRDECIKKAMKIKFNADPEAAPKLKGAITYVFNIN